MSNKIDILHDRAHMFSRARHFFAERKILEVDVPVLTQKAPINEHIDLVTCMCMGKKSYLQSSPEYGMKRLLAEGIGDIYQLGHVYRDGEKGNKHNPEFVMAEWYRIGFSFKEMIEETLAFLRLFLDVKKIETLNYKEAFQKHAQIDITTYKGDRDELFAIEVEPKLGNECFTILKGFPPEEAALSQIREENGELVAMRFEFFYRGFELANGYHELIDPIEQKKRLEEQNEKRRRLNKEQYPIDTHLLSALEKGLPDMCGVACGFDRLMMLKHQAQDIEEVIPFGWENT